jgi:hypothetical protein
MALGAVEVTAIDTRGDNAWVVDRGAGQVYRVDLASEQVVAGARLDGELVDVTVGFGFAWVADNAGDTVIRLDADTLEDQTFIPVGVAPIAVTAAHGKVWVSDGGVAGRRSTAAVRPTLRGLNPADGRAVVARALGEMAGKLVSTRDALWFADGRRLLDLDPETLQVRHTIRVKRSVDDLAAFGDDVWFVDGRGLARVNAERDTREGLVDAHEEVWSVEAGESGLWILDPNNDRALKLDPKTGDVLRREQVVLADDLIVGRGVWVYSEYRNVLQRVE